MGASRVQLRNVKWQVSEQQLQHFTSLLATNVNTPHTQTPRCDCSFNNSAGSAAKHTLNFKRRHGQTEMHPRRRAGMKFFDSSSSTPLTPNGGVPPPHITRSLTSRRGRWSQLEVVAGAPVVLLLLLLWGWMRCKSHTQRTLVGRYFKKRPSLYFISSILTDLICLVLPTPQKARLPTAPRTSTPTTNTFAWKKEHLNQSVLAVWPELDRSPSRLADGRWKLHLASLISATALGRLAGARSRRSGAGRNSTDGFPNPPPPPGTGAPLWRELGVVATRSTAPSHCGVPVYYSRWAPCGTSLV